MEKLKRQKERGEYMRVRGINGTGPRRKERERKNDNIVRFKRV